MATNALRRGSAPTEGWTAKTATALAVILAVTFFGCSRDGGPTAAKDSDEHALPALAKPAGVEDGTSHEDKSEDAQTNDATKAADVPPTTKDDVDDGDDADDGRDVYEPDDAAPRDKTKHPKTRRRASSAAADGSPQATMPSKLAIKRILLSQKIASREPVDPDETFSAAQIDDLYAFVELANPEKRASKINVSFVPPMGAPSKVSLKVGDASLWRTWAKRRSPKAVGTWHVVVTDEHGRELGKQSFEVTE